MISNETSFARQSSAYARHRLLGLVTAGSLAAVAMLTPASAQAGDLTEGYEVPYIGGKLHMEHRLRMELADQQGPDFSDAWTMRNRVGYETPTWEGLSAYAEYEGVITADSDSYFDVVSTPNGKTAVADPEEQELNRAFLKLERDEWDLKIVGGRQRIKLDDDRFIGNVGWRQNEQTYDAALGSTSFGVEGLSLTHAYIWDVRRIFGDDGGAATQDYNSDSHLVRAAYDVAPWFQPVAFAYLLDFSNSDGNSANSYGLRVTGTAPIEENSSLAYQFSYAYQTDAAKNPVDYEAHYLLADAIAKHATWGGAGVGFELLGSDDGKARFVTPLATAHKFNGWADVFLDNGGVNGLRDFYVYVTPALPWQLKGKIVYHRFESDEEHLFLGEELDAAITKVFNRYISVTAKFARFWGDDSGDPADITRVWLQTDITI